MVRLVAVITNVDSQREDWTILRVVLQGTVLVVALHESPWFRMVRILQCEDEGIIINNALITYPMKSKD